MELDYKIEQTLYPMIPGSGINVRYAGNAEIEGDDVQILSVEVFVNSIKDPFVTLPEERDAPEFYATVREQVRQSFWALALDPFVTLPEERDAPEFYATVREQVRQSFWALALRAARDAGYTNPQDINDAAEMWQRTGKACLVFERGLSTDED